MSRKSESEAPEPFTISAPEPRRPSGRAILLAGVAGACVLGVGLGLWARPGMHERQAALVAPAKAPPPAPAAAQQLEIVVDDHPRAAGAPIEVLPPAAAAAQPAPAVAAPPAPVVPRMAPAPQGLLQAHDTAPPAIPPHEASPLKTVLPVIAAAFTGAKVVLAKLEHPEPAVAAAAPPPAPERHDVHKAELAKAQARELEIARADAARAQAHRAALAKAAFEAQRAEQAQQAKAEREARLAEAAAEKAEAAKAAAARLEAHRLALAKAQAAKAEAHRQALARAETVKAHKIELAREAKAEKAEQLKLAKAEARAKAAQREEARLEALADAAEAKKRHQLARLAHALVHVVTGRDRTAPVEEAKADRRHARAAAHEAQVQQASLKARRRHDAPRLTAAHPPRVRPEPAVPQPAASGLMRVSTPARCASRDAGAALVCADPGLSAAERQLARAYQGARNAGVPDAELQQGQQRWLAARSSAAREAPWAVRDVYMARIAELNGQAKEAQGGY